MHTRSKRVSRCLFGKPDHEELEKWLTEELEAIQMERVKIYSFDFKKGHPIASTASKTYIFEAVPENEVPQFYRTIYYPSKERRKSFTPPPLIAGKCSKKKLENRDDVVAYHTRSRDAAAAKTSNFILPKVPKSRITAPQSRHRAKILRSSPLKARDERKRQKLSQKSGTHKKRMKQALLTNYLPVVRRHRTLTCSQSDCSDSPKLLDASPVRTECLGSRILNMSSIGVRTRCQSRRSAESPPSKRLRSAC